jgi:hypothetical protein
MGYNPYKPHISSNSSETRAQIINSTVGSTIASSSTLPTLPYPTSSPSTLSREHFKGIGDEIKEQLEMALLLIISSEVDTLNQEEDEERRRKRVCLETMIKMLSNILTHPNEAKFR